MNTLAPPCNFLLDADGLPNADPRWIGQEPKSLLAVGCRCSESAAKPFSKRIAAAKPTKKAAKTMAYSRTRENAQLVICPSKKPSGIDHISRMFAMMRVTGSATATPEGGVSAKRTNSGC
jgi:hypothetical protein